MNKKIIKYIFFTFVILFGFYSDVKADSTELTCVYEGTWNSDAVMFIQRNNKITLYKNTKEDNPSYDDKNWKIFAGTIYSDSSYYDKSSKLFSNCPQFSDYSGNVSFYFYDNDKSNYYRAKRDFQHHKLIPSVSGNIAQNPPKTEKVDTNNFNYDKSLNEMSCKNVKQSLKNSWYAKPVSNNNTICLYVANNGDDNCKILQIEFNNADLYVASSLQLNNNKVELNFTAPNIKEAYGDNMCPVNIFYEGIPGVCLPTPIPLGFCVDTGEKLSLTGDASSRYSLIRSTVKNELNIPYEEVKIETCEDMLSEEIVGYLKFAFNAIKIAIPLILIGLGIVDFARGVFSSEDEMKKIQEKFIKRIIVALGFFLIPSILGILLDIAREVFDLNIDFCGLF